MNYISTIETTGANLQKDVKYAWSKFVNQGVAMNHKHLQGIPSYEIRWTDGECPSCWAECDPYATGCSKCHYSFTD